MQRLSNGDSRIELLKELPRRPLEPAAEQAILQALREEEKRGTVKRKRRTRRYALLAVPAVAALIAWGLLSGVVNRAADGLFGSRPAVMHTVELSPLFDLLDKDGSVVYPDRLRGIQGKIAYSEYWGDFVANSGRALSKIFWYVWGDPQRLNGATLVATGVDLSTGKQFLVNETKLSGPIYGADAHTVTRFNKFPSKGTWRIDVEIDGEPYGSIVIHVKDEYIHTKSSSFLLSKDDAKAGSTETTLTVNGHDLADTLDVIVQPVGRTGEARRLHFVKTEEYVQSDGLVPVTEYSGSLIFDAPGEWRIEVLGEKTVVEVRS